MFTELDYRAFGRRLHERRRALNLTQADLAAGIGVSASFIGHLERAEKVPSLETAAWLSAYVDVNLDWLALGRKGAGCDRSRCPLYMDLARLTQAYRP